MQRRREGSEGGAHAGHPGLRHRQRERTLHEQGHRAPGDGLGRVVVAVGPRAGDAREARAGLDPAAVVGDGVDLDVRIAGELEPVELPEPPGPVETGEEVAPTHACASSRLGCGNRRVPVAPGPTEDGGAPHPGHPVVVGTRSYASADRMICWNTGAAASAPKMLPCGESTTTIAARRGLSAGANPANEALYSPVS